MTLLQDNQLTSFQRDGFVVVPDLLTRQELDHYQPLLRAAVARRKRYDPNEDPIFNVHSLKFNNELRKSIQFINFGLLQP